MSRFAATPIIIGQTIVYAGAGNVIKAVKLVKEGDKTVGKELWTNTENPLSFNTPVLKDGKLFGVNGTSQFFCIDTETGKTAWIGPRDTGGGYGSVVDAGTVLLGLTPGSNLVVIQPTDKEYTELARIKVADSPTYAHLVVAGNRLFVKDQDSVALITVE
jgi:outer membrane protein assembly factor BamB